MRVLWTVSTFQHSTLHKMLVLIVHMLFEARAVNGIHPFIHTALRTRQPPLQRYENHHNDVILSSIDDEILISDVLSGDCRRTGGRKTPGAKEEKSLGNQDERQGKIERRNKKKSSQRTREANRGRRRACRVSSDPRGAVPGGWPEGWGVGGRAWQHTILLLRAARCYRCFSASTKRKESDRKITRANNRGGETTFVQGARNRVPNRREREDR